MVYPATALISPEEEGMLTLAKLSKIACASSIFTEGKKHKHVIDSAQLTMLRKKIKLSSEADEEPAQNSPNEYNSKEILPFAVVSRYFPQEKGDNISSAYLEIERNLKNRLNNWSIVSNLKPSKIMYVYQPLDYASVPHELFINRYCNGTKKVLFVGINPGPFGMCQTGVPFGEVNVTQNWLKISGEVGRPSIECPARKITGFSCTNSEVSGKRFWGLFQKLCETPDVFFKNCFVYNYCPLAFMDEKGKNITPQDIKGDPVKSLEAVCDEAFLKIIKLLQVEIIVAIGRYTEEKIKKIVAGDPINENLTIHYLLHPSPIIPNNGNWDQKAETQLAKLDLLKYLQA